MITLETLLKLEEEQYGTSQTNGKKKAPKFTAGATNNSLNDKIVNIFEPLHHSIPKCKSFFFRRSSDFQDPDVLTVLSSQPALASGRNVAPSVSARTSAATGFYPASVDWEILIDWLSIFSDSGDKHLLEDCKFEG